MTKKSQIPSQNWNLSDQKVGPHSKMKIKRIDISFHSTSGTVLRTKKYTVLPLVGIIFS